MSRLDHVLEVTEEKTLEKNLEIFAGADDKIEEDFVEKYLEPFFLSLGEDPAFFEDLKKEHFAHGASVSYIDKNRPGVITVEYPDGRKEFLPCENPNY